MLASRHEVSVSKSRSRDAVLVCLISLRSRENMGRSRSLSPFGLGPQRLVYIPACFKRLSWWYCVYTGPKSFVDRAGLVRDTDRCSMYQTVQYFIWSKTDMLDVVLLSYPLHLFGLLWTAGRMVGLCNVFLYYHIQKLQTLNKWDSTPHSRHVCLRHESAIYVVTY